MAVQKPTATPKNIAIILASVRPDRLAPKVLKLALSVIQRNLPSNTKISIVDLAHWKLPVFQETDIPAMIQSSDNFSSELARAWSREISQYDGFVWMVPEYNHSYPGALKNALDYLYHEWQGKPSMIVSYGAQPVELLRAGEHWDYIMTRMKMHVTDVITKISISTMDREKTKEGEELVFYEQSTEEAVKRDVERAWEAVTKALDPVEKLTASQA